MIQAKQNILFSVDVLHFMILNGIMIEYFLPLWQTLCQGFWWRIFHQFFCTLSYTPDHRSHSPIFHRIQSHLERCPASQPLIESRVLLPFGDAMAGLRLPGAAQLSGSSILLVRDHLGSAISENRSDEITRVSKKAYLLLPLEEWGRLDVHPAESYFFVLCCLTTSDWALALIPFPRRNKKVLGKWSSLWSLIRLLIMRVHSIYPSRSSQHNIIILFHFINSNLIRAKVLKDVSWLS